MGIRYILTDYVKQAMAHAVYDKLEGGTFAGRIPQCKGVVATLRECEEVLRSTLEDWILFGLKLGHPLPVIAKIFPAHATSLWSMSSIAWRFFPMLSALCPQLRMMIREVEEILECKITADEWNRL